MVVTFLPDTCETGVTQERVAAPATWTVHAPQRPAPQPYFVPLSCKESRNTQSSGVPGDTFTFFALPFTRSENSAMGSSSSGRRALMVMELKRKKNGADKVSGHERTLALVSCCG